MKKILFTTLLVLALTVKGSAQSNDLIIHYEQGNFQGDNNINYYIFNLTFSKLNTNTKSSLDSTAISYKLTTENINCVFLSVKSENKSLGQLVNKSLNGMSSKKNKFILIPNSSGILSFVKNKDTTNTIFKFKFLIGHTSISILINIELKITSDGNLIKINSDKFRSLDENSD